MKRKICPYCNADNPEAAVFCKKCGALFVGEPEYIDPVKEKMKVKNKVIFAVCVVLLIIAFLVFKSGSADDVTPVTQPPVTSETTTVITTSSETTTEPTAPVNSVTTTVEPTTQANATTAPSTNAPSTTAPLSTDTEAICEKYNTLISDLKNTSGTLRVHKIEKISMQITEFSLPISMSAINTFMANLIPETDTVHNFTDGVSDNKRITLTELIPPSNKSAEVSADDLVSATEDANGTITLKFKADSSSFSDGQTDPPLYVSSATDILDFETFSLGPVKIISADMEYPGSEIKVEVDENGAVKKLTIYQHVNLLSTGSVGSLTANIGMILKATTTFQIG